MAFRFDMQGKTSQQQAIVAKRDAENARRQEEANKSVARKSRSSSTASEFLVLTLDEDICPVQSDTITQADCVVCKYYKSTTESEGQMKITCSYRAKPEKC